MATTQRRSRHQLTDEALAAIAEQGDSSFQEPDPEFEQAYPGVVDAEHLPRCLHIA
jgi:hypothetical protein